MTDENPAKQEFDAIARVHAALEPLDEDARGRVLTYIASLLGIVSQPLVRGQALEAESQDHAAENGNLLASTSDYGTFAELFDAARPETNTEMALVAAYWLQVCQGADSFTAQAASKDLANLGYKLANITKALTDLKETKPALVLQLKKSGTSQQARKTYKVSVAGTRRVEEMIRA